MCGSGAGSTKSVKLQTASGSSYTFKLVRLNKLYWRIVNGSIFGCDKITDWKLKELERAGRLG